ncbi:class I SAM-dependent DNA methyltransferase [Bacillus massilinigeriensis]|uniref:class I SAM-dependent DNA methyltransferase n=1 Tax=Bacillus mediterraneensis TaxID=1805474 RepID=UPI0008F8448F|nr:class I SAM-dependent methyltransferase [Bacillus mediterraneensis]
MNYRGFAYLYDELMSDVPYDDWVNWTRKAILERPFVSKKRLLDIACGTGELSLRFANAGFDVTGLDLSEDMLAVANSKAMEQGISIPFIMQDMSDMEGLGSFDIAVIFCDSLNYLPNAEAVRKTFEGVSRHLEPGGTFLFDVHSCYKINTIFAGNTFTLNEEHIAYIWDCYPGSHPDSVEHDLTFFVENESTGLYERIDESHFQRTFPPETYKELLYQAGFSNVSIMADFQETSPGEDSERIFFTALKPLKK